MKIPKAKSETKRHKELRLNLIKRMKSDPIEDDTWIDKVYGKPCKTCGLRKYSPATVSSLEGGRPSVCKCDDKE